MAMNDSPRVSDDQASKLTTTITEKETIDAIKELNNEGSPGPDGTQVFFYKEMFLQLPFKSVEQFKIVIA
mgnify:CR=1 FL=1